MAIEIKFLSNIVGFLKGTNNMGDALDDVADTLDDVAKDAQKAGDRTGDALKHGTRDAEEGVDRLERSFKDMADEARRSSARAGDSMKHNMHEGTASASRDLEELKDEAIQNASETFSSFDGSVDSLVDGIQGTLGGVISNIGPLGAAAGAAAAIGIGLLTAELQKSAERANEVRQETSDLAKEILDAGGNIDQVDIVSKVRDWSLEIADNKEWWEFWQKGAVTNLQQVEDVAKKTGYNVSEVFDAMSGQDLDGALDMLGDMKDRLKDVNYEYTMLQQGDDWGGSDRAVELKREKDALEKGTKAIQERIDIQTGGVEDAKLLNELTKERAQAEEDAARATKAHDDAVQSLQGGIDEVIGSYEDYEATEDEAADPAGYIDAMNKRIAATSNFNENVQQLSQKFGFTMEETQALLDQGVDFAPLLQSIIDSGMEKQFADTFRKSLSAGQSIVDGTPIDAKVNAKADTAQAASDLDKTAEDRDTTVEAKADTKIAATELDSFTKKNREAMIKAVMDFTGANSSLSSWLNTPRSITVTADLVTREGKPIP